MNILFCLDSHLIGFDITTLHRLFVVVLIMDVMHNRFQLDRFDAAKAYCEKFRAQLPAIYNESRLKKNQRMLANTDEILDTDLNIIEVEDVVHLNNKDDSDIQNVSLTSTFNVDIDERENQSISSRETIPTDNKDPLATVILEQNEVNAFDMIFDDNTTDDDSHVDSTNEMIVFSPGGTKRTTKRIDSDCEMTYIVDGNSFKPYPAGYQIKINDILTENIPFKENASICDFFIDLKKKNCIDSI